MLSDEKKITVGSTAVITIHRLILFLRIFLFVPIRILSNFIPTLSARFRFELQNHIDPASQSFRGKSLKADIAFHVSSEGELEQVRPLIDFYLKTNKYLEIVYTSPSVDHRCQKLYSAHPAQIRIFRLPLLSYLPLPLWGGQSINHWITAKQLVMCRYDFYPELLLLTKAGLSIILVSATLKGKTHKLNSSIYLAWRVYWRELYSLFSSIIVATPNDEDRFLQLGIKSKPTYFDFRIIQIASRVAHSQKELRQTNLDTLLTYLEKSIPREKRVLMGSAWPNEMAILSSPSFVKQIADGQIQLTIAPHQLAPESITEISEAIRSYVEASCPVYTITPQMSAEEQSRLITQMSAKPGPIITTVPAKLCELYTCYGHVFVGGGHGRSVHSLLEPYLAGANIFCGPKTFRSTEYDLIKKHSSPFITIVDSLPDFYHLLGPIISRSADGATREKLIDHHQKRFPTVAQELLGD
jgi:3-deoxy-D-manno-octulosonic-acid transferase